MQVRDDSQKTGSDRFARLSSAIAVPRRGFTEPDHGSVMLWGRVVRLTRADGQLRSPGAG